VLVVVGYVLALGYVSPSLGIRLPLAYAARGLPFLAGLRATQRFSLVIYMGILLLSSLGMARVAAWRPRWATAATAALCALFLVEVFPVVLPFSASHPYSPSVPDRFIAQYQQTRSAPLVVLHLPIHQLRDAYPTDEAIYMTDSTWHWARILNGFSGGEPFGFIERMRILGTLPEPAAVSLVRQLGVDLIAVHGAAARAGNPLWDFFSRQEWARVIRFPNGEFVVMVTR
jgi:ABC-type transport system involved in multi-copper enzyme maturation permease subunit